MRYILNFFVFLLVFCQVDYGYAWSGTGHKIIAQIAYNHLTPQAKRYYVDLNQSLNHDHRRYTWVASAVWLDTLYDPKYAGFKAMHYIDLPETVDGTLPPAPSTMNAIIALDQAIATLKKPASTPTQRAIALRIILHVVGDIHQPLHTIARVSRAHPNGDRGGNDFHLGRNKVGKTLHRYWDQGGGWLRPKLSGAAVRKTAKRLEKTWHCPPPNPNIRQWVQDSHALAVHEAYALAETSEPTVAYQRNTQRLCQQQVVYAGCRLGWLLNHLFSL